MTDRPDPSDGQGPEARPDRFVVPGGQQRAEDLSDDDLLVEAQQVRDLGSASRSCVAIIAVLLIVALLVCVFLFWAFFLQ
jgi:hypothetical protein